MSEPTYLLPVPTNPPNEGDFVTVSFNGEWIPIIIGLLEQLRSPVVWQDPPDNIVGQVDELIYLMSPNVD